MRIKQLITILLTIMINAFAIGGEIIPTYNMQQYNKVIEQLYQRLPQDADLSQRVDYFSRYFLGQPYQLGALGEGESGEFDQSPLYRTDAFDCTTYVATIVALANSQNLQQFQQLLRQINYHDGDVSYFKRNHFMTTDWNPSVQALGLAKDVTRNIVGQHQQSLAQTAIAEINKPAWYQYHQINSLKQLYPQSDAQQTHLLSVMRDYAASTQATLGQLAYLPLTQLFDEYGKPRQTVFKQLPTPAIVEIVRPNWPLKKVIGTNLNVSHMGILLRNKEGNLILRHASAAGDKQVVDVSLCDYLQQYLKSQTIKGINIQALEEKTT